MWVDRVFAFAGVLRDASWGLSCPFHCGGSWILSFVAGLSCGLLLGLALALGICYHFHLVWTSPTSVPCPPAGTDPLLLRRRARFSAYLHEWVGHHWTYSGHQPSCCCYRASILCIDFWSCRAAWYTLCLACDWGYQDPLSTYCPLPVGHLDSSLQQPSVSWCWHRSSWGPWLLFGLRSCQVGSKWWSFGGKGIQCLWRRFLGKGSRWLPHLIQSPPRSWRGGAC